MRPVDMNTWPRKAMFDHYSTLSTPFFGVSFRLDVTNLVRYCKENRLSFYHAMIYLCARTVNQIPDFRMILRDGQLYEIPARIPVFTDMPPESEFFHVVSVPAGEDCADFCRRAKEQNAAQSFFIDNSIPRDETLHCSCIPWVEMTGLYSCRDLDLEDTSPWVTWGKFVTEGDRKMLGFCLELNHRVNDGFHVGQFHSVLQNLIFEL